MATIYSQASDGYVSNTITGGPTWATVRGDATTAGSAISNTAQYNNFSIHSTYSGKGGGLFAVWRSYFSFDLSGESGTVEDTSLYLYSRRYLTGWTGDYAKVIAIQATPLAGSTADFGNVFTSGTTFGTVMSAGVEIVGTGYQYNEIPITGDTSSGGIKIINDAVGTSGAGGIVTIGVISHYYDYSNNVPDGTNPTNISSYYSEYTGDSRTPKLEITYASPGYGNDIAGIDSGDISTINGIATANISKVNGV